MKGQTKNKKSLSYFMSLGYNVILKKKKGRFYLFLPELSLLTEGNSLNTAYKNLEKEKEKYFKNIIKLDAQETVKDPLALTVRRKLFNELMIFFIKALIIVLIFLLIFLSSLPFMLRSLGQLPNRATEVITSLSDRLRDMPEDNKKEIRLKLKQAVEELKPMTDELKILWEDEGDAQKQGVGSYGNFN